jgi:hypothetical protein
MEYVEFRTITVSDLDTWAAYVNGFIAIGDMHTGDETWARVKHFHFPEDIRTEDELVDLLAQIVFLEPSS